MKLWRKLLSLPILLALLPIATATVNADTLTGEVRGVVLDVDGGVPLAGVEMTLVNIDRGWEKKQPTDSSGNFAFLQLEPGNYSVIAEVADYYRQEKTGVLIRLNQPKVVLPPFMLRKEVPTPTQQLVVQGEGGQTRTAVVDLTATGPNPLILAYLEEPGFTSLVSLLDWAIRANYGASLLEALPLRGVRSFDQLALLSAGVARVPYSGGDGPAVGIGVGQAGQFAVNGLRGRSNNFTVDGSDNNDEDIGVRRQGFVSLVPQSNESVQEFQITTAGFPAEFGRNSGSMVNAVSRSGGNEVHGRLYGLFGDGRLDSRNLFEQPFEDTINTGDLNGGRFVEDDFRQQILGGVVGGPIVTDKLFYFGSIEKQRERATRLGHFIVPTTGERGLRTRAGFVPLDELDEFFDERLFSNSTLAAQGVFSLYPLPNNPGGPFAEHTYSQSRKAQKDGIVYSGKLDWYLSSVHSLTGRYNVTDDKSLIPFTGESFNSSLATRTQTQNVSLFLNSSWARFGNALRASYGRTDLRFPPELGSPLIFGSAALDPIPDDLAGVEALRQTIETPYGRFGPFGTTGPIGQLEIAPYSGIGVDVFNFPQARVDNTIQLSDFFTLTTSNHTTKFGFDMRRTELNSFADRNARPLLYFGNGRTPCDLTNFSCVLPSADRVLRGTDLVSLALPSGFLQTISTQASPSSAVGLRFSQFELFIQHDWKLHPRFNLNLGLRYERASVPTDRRRRIEDTLSVRSGDFDRSPDGGSDNTNFDDAVEALRGFLGNRTRIYRPDNDNWAPRVGFAWDPSGHGSFVIRAGYGISYDAILGAVTSQSRNVFPTFVPINLSPNSLNSVRPNSPRGLCLSCSGFLVPNLAFLSFGESPVIRPGTINASNLPADVFATAVGRLLNQGPLVASGNGFREVSVNGLAFTLPETEPKTGYAEHFVVSLQKQLGLDFLATAEFVASQGLHLTRFTTPNGGILTTPVYLITPNSQVLNLRDLSPTRPMPALGAYRVFENSASSSYRGLQTGLEKRFGHGYELRANWTWSHVIDEVSDPFDSRGFFALPQNGARFDLERASANFDARHRVTFLFAWELPGGSTHPALGNWKIAGVGEFQTGQPFTVNTSLDRNLDGNLTDRLDTMEGLALFPGSGRPIRLNSGVDPISLVAPFLQNGRVGRNTFRADGISTIDLAVSRSFQLAEESRLDFRLEVFNLFDSKQFGVPIRILESPGFGRAYDTQVDSRSLRVALKLSF